MPNWKQLIEAKKAKKYVLPKGWDSIAKIARVMDASEDAARRDLAPFVRSGEFEMQIFPVWDTLTKRLVRVTAYHPAAKNKGVVANAPKRDKRGHFIKQRE